MNDIIQLAGFGSTSLTATDAARQQRDVILAGAKKITNVCDRDSADLAALALREVKQFTRAIDDARSEVKAPVLDLGKRIDGLAKELVSDLETEATRLGKIIGAWQAEENRRAEEAQKKARDEEERIWREAQAKEQERQRKLAEEEAERKRKADEEQKAFLAKAERARTEAGRLRALEEAEARKIQEQIASDQRKAEEQQAAALRNQETGRQMVAARVEGMNVVAQKPVGVATRKEMMFEVTDIALLYKSAPYLVTLTPNTAAIKTALKGLQPGQTLPGVRHWEQAKTYART